MMAPGAPSCARQSAAGSPRGWYSRGYLPHLDHPELIQHITIRLGDSLPQDAIERMREDPLFLPEDQRPIARVLRIQEMLDAGRGACLLRDPQAAALVQESFLFGDGERYRLIAWVVMPNHAHVLIQPMAAWPVAKVVQCWKRHTTREMQRLGVAPGAVWQREYWDRFIRDERHYAAVRRCIDENPVKAGLVAVACAWPYGSAAWETAERSSALPESP